MDAAASLRRCLGREPTNREAHLRLVDLFLKKGDWVELETAARDALRAAPDHADLGVALAFALMRQDRILEAVDTLTAVLERGDHKDARALLEKIRKSQEQEKDLSEDRAAFFTLRYDGKEHEAVGRRVLEILERHYVTLLGRFGHQPPEAIPVILMTRQRYLGAGAPPWSGGEFDSFDGKIRVPIRGLTPSGVQELDRTLLHELTHVFVTDMTRGLAPRELQEGIAEFVEGERPDRAVPDDVPPEHAAVAAFYIASLRFVISLTEQGGESTLAAALAMTGETGDIDRAFRQFYGRTYEELRDTMNQPGRPPWWIFANRSTR